MKSSDNNKKNKAKPMSNREGRTDENHHLVAFVRPSQR